MYPVPFSWQYDAAGSVTLTIDARGNRTTYSMDSDNRQTQVTDALGNLSTTLYDTAGNVTTSIDARGNRTTYAYDLNNRMTAATDQLNHTVTTMFDSAGNATTTIDQLGNRTTYAFDALNRRTSVQDPGTGVASTVYDLAGNVTNTIDPMGDKTTYAYDLLNRKTGTIDARGGITTLAFDPVGNETTVVDPVGNRTTFAFDAINRQTQMTDPLNHSGTMAFDKESRLTSATDRDGNVISYSYDAIDRKTGETWTVSGVTANTFTYTYDANSNMLSAANSAGTYTLAYDKLNRMTAIQEPYGLLLTLSFDPVGNRTQVQDSLSGITTSTYDPANRLTSRQFGGSGQTPLRMDLTYTGHNDIATETRYSDLAGTQLVGSSTYSYDAVERLTHLQHYNSATIMANYTYSYDLASRLTQEQDDGTTTAYGYDTTNELTSAGATNYSYDLNGNRTMTGYTTGTDNQLTNDGTWTYSYDQNGNLTKKSKGASAETWFYGYDNENRLLTAKQESTDGGTVIGMVTYIYDALRNRLAQSEWTSTGGLTVTSFAYDGQNVWADLNGSNQLQMRRSYLDQVDQIFARVDGSGNAAWYLTDHLGSVRIVMNSADTTTDVVAYDAFGNITSESNSGFGDRYKWTAREYAGVTSLQYNHARYYSPKIGRWTTLDPIGFRSGDANQYCYVSNSPITLLDPLGTIRKTFTLAGESSPSRLSATDDAIDPANGSPNWIFIEYKGPKRDEVKWIQFSRLSYRTLPNLADSGASGLDCPIAPGKVIHVPYARWSNWYVDYIPPFNAANPFYTPDMRPPDINILEDNPDLCPDAWKALLKTKGQGTVMVTITAEFLSVLWYYGWPIAEVDWTHVSSASLRNGNPSFFHHNYMANEFPAVKTKEQYNAMLDSNGFTRL